jgi:hypothetical protein
MLIVSFFQAIGPLSYGGFLEGEGANGQTLIEVATCLLCLPGVFGSLFTGPIRFDSLTGFIISRLGL